MQRGKGERTLDNYDAGGRKEDRTTKNGRREGEMGESEENCNVRQLKGGKVEREHRIIMVQE